MQGLLDTHPPQPHHHHHHHNYKREDAHSTTSDSLIGCGSSGGGGGGLRRKPLQLLTGIFSRNKGGNRREGDSVSEGGEKSFYITDESVTDDVWREAGGGVVGGSLGGMVGGGGSGEEVPEPREALHSPYHAKTIDQDMENLRLSRQDNPFLQVLASRECLHDSDDADDGSEYEEKSLMAQNSKESGGMKDPLTLAEVHARLVRSPPPIMWTRNRNSEPSFALLSSFHSSSDQECVFRFPPKGCSSGGGGMMAGSTVGGSHGGSVGGGFHRMITDTPIACRSHHHHPFANTNTNLISSSNNPQRILDGCCGGGLRFRERTLDDVTGKFNLSPQPRRRPSEGIKSFSEFHS